jgi:hypothetical protein
MASQAALISETIAGMKKAVKRKAYGSLPSSIHPPSSLVDTCLPHRLGFRQFYRAAHESRQQIKEEGKIYSRGSIGTSERTSGLQKSLLPSLEVQKARADVAYRKLSTQVFIERL